MEIIIDGVDVSGCPYAEPAYKTPKCIINRYIHCDGINCHYKRMIHTGIEKDLYKKENRGLHKQLKLKERECQQIMDNYTELDLQRIKECKNLKAEIDDLKEWKKTVVELFNRTYKCKHLVLDECSLTGKNCKSINKCMYDKHQALVKIKEYCMDQNLKADFTACEILQIVSEVLNEKEMGNNTSNKTATVQS